MKIVLVDAPCSLLYRYHVPEEPIVSIIGIQEVYFLNFEDGGVSSSETSVTGPFCRALYPGSFTLELIIYFRTNYSHTLLLTIMT